MFDGLLKGVLLFALSLITAIYTTFILTLLWGWFVAPAFHVARISFWIMYGLVLVASLFRGHGLEEKDMEDDRRWELLMTAVKACVPEDRREEVEAEQKYLSKGMWKVLGTLNVANVMANTGILGIAFVVHVIASGALP